MNAMATVLVNPDQFLALRRERAGADVSPANYRRKLRGAGLDQKLARAPKPDFRFPAMDFDRLGKISEQQRWTRMLIEMVSR
jgi:hypothetical protein